MGNEGAMESEGVMENEGVIENRVSDEMIEYVGILTELELSGEEREQVREDISSMLTYIDKLKELDTEGVEPMCHIFPVRNVFRDDVVTNGDESEELLRNTSCRRDNMFVVPKTFE